MVVTVGITLSALIWMSRLMSLWVTLKINGFVKPTIVTGLLISPTRFWSLRSSTPAHNDSSVTPTLRHNDQLENQRNICNDILLCHLNINSIQNKFEELVALIRKLKIHIIFISETKIDSTYPDSQFAIPGYTLYRNDIKKRRWRHPGLYIHTAAL